MLELYGIDYEWVGSIKVVVARQAAVDRLPQQHVSERRILVLVRQRLLIDEWDNSNVFQICTLNESTSAIRW